MDSKIKALIIEDDEKSYVYLKSLITKNFSDLEIISHSDNVKDSIIKINTLKPEIVFMDIVLKDGSAFEILENVDHFDFEVVFITGYDQYLRKAIEHYAFHYILKPIDISKLEEVIKRYRDLKERMFSLSKYKMFLEFTNDKFSKIMLHVNNEYVMVSLNEVIKCEADGNYTHFYLQNSTKLFASKSLKYYNELLSDKGFFKANRSILINIDHIKSIYKKEALILKNKERVIVSQRNKSNLTDLIKLFS